MLAISLPPGVPPRRSGLPGARVARPTSPPPQPGSAVLKEGG